MIEKVGHVVLGYEMLTVYDSLDEPLFALTDIVDILGYDKDSTNKIANLCEDDEKLLGTIFRSGQRRKVWLVTELGLYSILEQSRMPIARVWRRVINEQLIKMRRDKGYDIEQQFDEWSHEMDDYYIDEETGKLMRSVTVAGGDVIQVEA